MIREFLNKKVNFKKYVARSGASLMHMKNFHFISLSSLHDFDFRVNERNGEEVTTAKGKSSLTRWGIVIISLSDPILYLSLPLVD